MQMQQTVFTTPHPAPLATRTNQMKLEGYFFWEFFPVFFWDFFPVFWWKGGARQEERKEGRRHSPVRAIWCTAAAAPVKKGCLPACQCVWLSFALCFHICTATIHKRTQRNKSSSSSTTTTNNNNQQQPQQPQQQQQQQQQQPTTNNQ